MGTAEARCLLRGKDLLFVGNSVVRRQLYTVLDLVAGPAAHRQLTNFTDVKLPNPDTAADSGADTAADSGTDTNSSAGAIGPAHARPYALREPGDSATRARD